MKLSIIIPCFNEQENIKPMYRKLAETFSDSGMAVEFVYVNDGSSDGTQEELRRIWETSAIPMKVVRFSRNFGKEAAIYAGLKQAEGEYVSLIDGDLQQDPKYVLDMVRFLEENPEYDSVAAYQEKRKEGVILRSLKRTFYALINRISEVEFVDGASDFRTLRRSMADAILALPEYNRFSKGIFSWVGFQTYYMPYQVQERKNGKTKWSFWKLLRYAVSGIVSFSTMPLILSGFLGLLIALCSVIYLIIVVVQKLCFSIEIPGYATIVVLILLLGGIQLFALGIIGQYLAKTYMETKQRPIYVAKEILDSEKKRDGGNDGL